MKVSTGGLFVGLASLDVVHRVERSAGPDEKVTALRQDVAAGGPALGAALVHAALGGTTTLVTALGDDPAGAAVRADVERVGVGILAAGVAQTPVSAVRVLDATGERSVTGLDAAGQPPPALAPQGRTRLGELVAGSGVVLLDGHHAPLALAVAEEVGALRRRGQAAPVVVLDAGRWRPAFEVLLPLAEVVIASAAFTPPGDPLEERCPGFTARTAGAGPVRWCAASGEQGAVVVPALPGPVRDTLGAGDALHGAVAWALGAGHDPVAALELGVAVAGLRVQQPGARAWLDALPDLPELLLGAGQRP